MVGWPTRTSTGQPTPELLYALQELDPHNSLDWANRVIETIRDRAGLLIAVQEHTFRFPHRSFQEYLAALHLTKDKDFAWIYRQVGRWPGIHLGDYSGFYSQLALQGPRSLETLAKLTKVDLAAIKNYWFTWGTVAAIPNVIVARTGYSGEDGFELYISADETTTADAWNALLDAGAEFGIRPCGLGARNTLRLEAGMSLYGHEISEEINVFEAGLTRWLKLDKGEFIGRDALLAIQAEGGPKRKIIGLEMVERGIARDSYPVHSLAGEPIGIITSGSPAPFLKSNIAMALVPLAVAESGKDVLVDVRGNRVRAKQVPLPFYKRPKKA